MLGIDLLGMKALGMNVLWMDLLGCGSVTGGCQEWLC